jgi:hypothetical protein
VFTVEHSARADLAVWVPPLLLLLLLQFLSRPFVAGDSITVQSTRHVIVSGTVERITPLRTLMRTDDDVLVTVPNKVRLGCCLLLLSSLLSRVYALYMCHGIPVCAELFKMLTAKKQSRRPDSIMRHCAVRCIADLQ